MRQIGKDVDGVRTVFGWDGDQLAYESSEGGATQYVYEPESFVPLAQYVTAQPVAGIQTPVWREGEPYVPENDPLQRVPERQSDAHLFYYHCDQIGTPLLMTDEIGEVVWEASYRAWGEAREVIARVSQRAGIAPRNPMRFQGLQADAERGLRYNRNRYYDPNSGRFVSKDPIGLAGGTNVYQYAPNPVQWIDPLGLARCPCDCLKKGNPEGNGPYRGGSYGGKTASGIESHHMPADSVSPLARSQGPAIQTDPNDHEKTMSHGYQGNAGKAYRAIIGSKVEAGDWRGAMAMEVRDIRRVAAQVGDPRRYNEAMREMLAYSKCRGFLKK